MAANRYSTGLLVANERWVSRRWKPIVTPKPVMQVHDAEEDEVMRAHAVAPEEGDGGEEGDERDDDGEQIRDSGGS